MPSGPYLNEIEVGRTVAYGEGQVTRLNHSPEGYLASIDRKDDGGTWQRFITLALDSRGKPIAAADALDRTSQYSYDALGRLLSMTDPLGKTTQYRYDALDNRTAVIDANLNQTRYQYDALSRLTRIEQQGISPVAVTLLSYQKRGQYPSISPDPFFCPAELFRTE